MMKSLHWMLLATLALAINSPDPAVAQPKRTTKSTATTKRPAATARPAVYRNRTTPRLSQRQARNRALQAQRAVTPMRQRQASASRPRPSTAREAALGQIRASTPTGNPRTPARSVTFRGGGQIVASSSGTQRRNRQRARSTGARQQTGRVGSAQRQANQRVRTNSASRRTRRPASPMLNRLQPVNAQNAAASRANTVLGQQQLAIRTGAAAGAPDGTPPNPGNPSGTAQGGSRSPSPVQTRRPSTLGAASARAADVLNNRDVPGRSVVLNLSSTTPPTRR